MTKPFPTVGRRRALPLVVLGAALALVAGLFAATGAGATTPEVSISSVVCDHATNDVNVTLGSIKSWWNFEITADKPGVNIDTNTASKTISFVIPRSKLPVTLAVRYHQDTVDVKYLVIDSPSCIPVPPVTPTTTTTTTIPPVAPTTTTAGPTGPTTTVPSGVTSPTTTTPVEVESKTTTKTTSSGGAVPVKVATISYAG